MTRRTIVLILAALVAALLLVRFSGFDDAQAQVAPTPRPVVVLLPLKNPCLAGSALGTTPIRTWPVYEGSTLRDRVRCLERIVIYQELRLRAVMP